MASPYLQRPPRSLKEARGDLERHRGQRHEADGPNRPNPESGKDIAGQNDKAGDL